MKKHDECSQRAKHIPRMSWCLQRVATLWIDCIKSESFNFFCWHYPLQNTTMNTILKISQKKYLSEIQAVIERSDLIKHSLKYIALQYKYLLESLRKFKVFVWKNRFDSWREASGWKRWQKPEITRVCCFPGASQVYRTRFGDVELISFCVEKSVWQLARSFWLKKMAKTGNY